MRTSLFVGMAAAGLLASTASAHAQDRAGIAAGDWLVRLRGIVVAPNESSSGITPALPAARVGVGDSVMPEVDFTYMATDHIGAELIVSSTRHDLQGRDAISSLGKVGHTWVLPPTLTLQYHFRPKAPVRPYLGAGINYTTFYSAKTSDSLNKALGRTSLSLKDSVGYALQAGVDIDLNKKFFLNLDVKYIDMTTTARLNTGGAINQTSVDINPLVFGFGVGTRF
ncbi:OmpW family protein [Sphingomonas sp.]|uniref:OmpW/AlkL family protein n=1 Tax=Sphingomonas sp. TaxID=28214 RepID=UPI0028B019EB|nr:OmpW family protein [Sphingomonas sp.]